MRSKRAKLSALLIAGVVAASGWAASATESEVVTDRASDLTVLDFLALPFVEEKPDGSVVVDFSGDADAAFAALEKVHDELDGRQVTLMGIDAPSSNSRRSGDAELSKNDPPVRETLCPDLPTSRRSNDGSTVAFLGCDPVTGIETTGRARLGDLEPSLTAAFDQVLSTRLPDISSEGVDVSASGGVVLVDLPPAYAVLIGRLPSADGWDLAQALIFTAYSNGNVDSVQFAIDGDCLKFALLTGGDMCSTITLDELTN